MSNSIQNTKVRFYNGRKAYNKTFLGQAHPEIRFYIEKLLNRTDRPHFRSSLCPNVWFLPVWFDIRKRYGNVNCQCDTIKISRLHICFPIGSSEITKINEASRSPPLIKKASWNISPSLYMSRL